MGFAPAVVVLRAATPNYQDPTLRLRRMPTLPGPDGSMAIQMTWGENGLSWYAGNSAISQGNADGTTYYYVAIGCEA